MSELHPSLGGGKAASWNINPSLPNGMSFTNGVISGTPIINMTQTSYTIWANNTGGSAISYLNITIN